MTERDFVEELRREYVAKGFTELAPKTIAESLHKPYEPDLAFKVGDRVDVIELKSKKRPQSANQIRRLRRMIEALPNWHFRFVAVPKGPAMADAINAEETVSRRFRAARDLARSDPELAIIQLWMAIEICLRRLLKSLDEQALSDASAMEMARMVRNLGELTDEDLQLLEKGFRIRNLAAHGFRLPPDRKIPARLFDFASDLGARVGIGLPENQQTAAPAN
jgi:hypothetical protein